MKESNNIFDDIISEDGNAGTGSNQLEDDISIDLAGNYQFGEEEINNQNNVENNIEKNVENKIENDLDSNLEINTQNNKKNNLENEEEINLQGIGEDDLEEQLFRINPEKSGPRVEEPDLQTGKKNNEPEAGGQQNQQIKEEELYFDENQLNQDVQVNPPTTEELEAGGNLNIGEIGGPREVPGDNLFQGILAENGLAGWEDMEVEARNVQREEALAKENQLKANLAAEAEKKAKEEEAKKKAEEEKKLKAEEKAAIKEAKRIEAEEAKKKKEAEKIPERHFDTPYMRGHAEYYSEQRGYKDHAFEEGVNTKNAEEIHVLKYAMREIGKGTATKSKEQKKLVKDLEAFDTFMKEIEGRTKLTPREMEVYDKLSLKVYKSGKEYREHLLERNEKEKKAFDEKHKNDKYKVEYEMRDSTHAKLEGTNQLMETIERMRKETFKKEMEEKQKELAEKCRKEADKAEAIRDEMDKYKNDPNNLKALQHNMEESIARTIFYNNRIERLSKQGEFSVKPDESLSKARERLDKAIQPTPAELDQIKKTDLCKSLYDKGWEKMQKGDLLTTEDISKAQQEYKKAEGSRIGMRKWREQNMRPVNRNERNNNNPEMQRQNQPPQMGPRP